MDWNDRIRTIREEGNDHTTNDVLVSELDATLKDKAESRKLVRFDTTVDLTSLGALATGTLLALPASAVVVYAAMKILETVVAGGTTVKLGLGPSGTKNKYGNLAALTADTHNELVLGTVISATENVLLNGVATGGSAAGDTNISAGSVRIVIEYFVPNALA